MKTDDIRDKFLNFFAGKGARIVPSDSLVPHNDPTLLFTGAGMNQFKDQFLGLRIEYRTAASCQKCIRTGDIMNVGATPAHHTFFEMLGNFSFGDYFKREAITWAWEFLTGAMAIPEARLRVSVHDSDDDAFGVWEKDVGLSPDIISRLGDHDNFWPADAPRLGPNGPCGPCSEIFYDRGPVFGCGKPDCGITCDCRRWVEIWNLVFTQFDRRPDGALSPLPQRNIDTGMGLERMAACLQGAATNMDIDIFRPLVAAVAAAAGKTYGAEGGDDVLMRRIADHVRAVAFCIGDGVIPANSHRGYVLKRLLRRAVLDGRNLGIRSGFLPALVPIIGRVMEKPYPEIQARAAAIAETIGLEEEKFLATLDRGLVRIGQAVGEARKTGASVLSGAAAFELYDTYGFPYELAEEILAREGLSLDRTGFDAAMAEARTRARDGARMKGDVFARGPFQEIKKLTPGTDFIGYDSLEGEGAVVAAIAGETLVAEAGSGSRVAVILDRTPFYGESGGQVGDTGLLIGRDNLVIRVDDTQKLDGIHIHVGEVESGTLCPGAAVKARVDAGRRQNIMRNHTTAHLLHHALRTVLGDNAEQKGSYVGPDRLRFDFQHPAALTPEERGEVEEIVNRRILENAAVVTRVLPIGEARRLGAVALFGEKYGDTVRVLSIGDYSLEFCGGTHMREVAPIGCFRLTAEEAVAAGVRRIEGVTGLAAFRLSREQGEFLSAIVRELKTAPREAGERIRAMAAEIRELEKRLAAFRLSRAEEKLEAVAPLDIAGGSLLLAADVGILGGKELGELARSAQLRLGDRGVAVLAGRDGDKAALAITVGKALAPARLKAGDLVKKLAPFIGGGGGGRPDFAQAGGRNPGCLPDLLAAAPAAIGELLREG
ncbi:MAG: alanine--tRNA ligase [Planctomycetota bacterium]|jgi:alanyl-tRNA synthetase|nr:alanine--tRNA ligase [Planctomycetota bacterium]